MQNTQPNRHGFTLLELLLVVGIIGLLAGILLPAVSKTYSKAIVIRTQADLQAISTALEAYKSDWGSYPVVTAANSGAAVLGKALIGPADEAILFTGSRSAPVRAGTLQNTKPVTYAPTDNYKAGDVVLNGGTMPSVNSFLDGSQNLMFVSVRDDNVGHTPGIVGDFWWTPFVPYDGNNGPGGRIRLADAADANGQPLAAAGKVYGPYLDPEKYKMSGPVLLDRYDSPILYFPINKAANPRLHPTAPPSFGWSDTLTYPPTVGTQSMVNLNDNLGPFVHPAATPAEASTNAAIYRVRVMLGDVATNGYLDSGTDIDPPALPFLLWTAGADKIFGPRGNGVANPGDWKLHDVVLNATSVDQQRLSAAACDDVTNFR